MVDKGLALPHPQRSPDTTTSSVPEVATLLSASFGLSITIQASLCGCGPFPRCPLSCQVLEVNDAVVTWSSSLGSTAMFRVSAEVGWSEDDGNDSRGLSPTVPIPVGCGSCPQLPTYDEPTVRTRLRDVHSWVPYSSHQPSKVGMTAPVSQIRKLSLPEQGAGLVTQQDLNSDLADRKVKAQPSYCCLLYLITCWILLLFVSPLLVMATVPGTPTPSHLALPGVWLRRPLAHVSSTQQPGGHGILCLLCTSVVPRLPAHTAAGRPR